MNGIEFFQYPSSAEDPTAGALLWGIRIDGTDLRVHAAEATREPWSREHEEDTREEEDEHLLTQHAGLPVRGFEEDHPGHFLTASDCTPVLGCTCGIWECWPLEARIEVTETTVKWSSFRQPHRPQWGELAMGPYEFGREAYEAALAGAVVLGEDRL